jgi:hypothetical protein
MVSGQYSGFVFYYSNDIPPAMVLENPFAFLLPFKPPLPKKNRGD